MDIVKIICALILPPLAVFLHSGIGKDFIINLVLSLIFFFPGVVHALWIIFKTKGKG